MKNSQNKRMKWDDWYVLAKQYYKEKGNLLVPGSYITENGYRLGNWINSIRKAKNHPETKGRSLNAAQIQKLNAIGMVWQIRTLPQKILSWDQSYELAKQYYKEKGDLLVSQNFTTKDGYKLGIWISNMRSAKNHPHTFNFTLSKEQEEKLDAIGMVWTVRTVAKLSWDEWYQLAESYYHANGNLCLPVSYITDEGYRLGMWICRQKHAIKYSHRYKFSNERKEKLKKLGII